MRITTTIATRICVGVWLAGCGLTRGQGEEVDTGHVHGFGMETEVRSKATGQIEARLTTLFVGSNVYDVVHGNPPDIARFNLSAQSVDLLDRKRRMQANLEFSQLLSFQTAIEAKARRVARNRDFGKFLAEPAFNKEYDATKSLLKLSSPWLSYEASIEPEDPLVVKQLAEFADWSARLAGIMSPISPPAAPRLVLNQELRSRNWRAVSITRSGGPRGVMSSHHQLRRQLTTNDEALAQGIEKDLKDFRRVMLAEFLEPAASSQVATKE